MKSIAIVTDNSTNSLGFFLRKNLEEVLSGYAGVRNLFLDEFPAEADIPDDVVLVMTKEKALDIKNRLRDAKRIIVAHRTIQKSEIYRICSIPPNTRVLVVNDSTETTLEMVSLLFRLGIDHLDLVPFDPKSDHVDIKIAITPGELIFVPKHIGSVIDTGHRYVDISTFIQIIDMLVLAEREVNERLFRYSENIIPLESGINSQYRQLYLKNLELDSMLNLSHEGVLLVDNEGVVSLHNRALLLMLETESDLVGKKLADHVQGPLLSLLNQDRLDNDFVQHRNHSFIVSSRILAQFGEKSGTYYNFRDITYIRQLEQNLNRKLQERGFVPKYSFADIRTASPAMQRSLALARKFAKSDLPVLIRGESGTGKELLAHAIHTVSDRVNRPFVAFNCAAMPENLIESELFGYEAGSFTGALKGGKIGLFEQANNGTIFLDEIGDLPLTLQPKLLRALQERQVMRVGSQKIVAVNIRVIAATNQDLERKLRAGQFREDLYYRLNVLPLPVPPLRERQEDILFLLRYFLKSDKGTDLRVSPGAEEALLRYPWPGNIRELMNAASYSSFLADGEITPDCLPDYILQRVRDFSEEALALARSGMEDEALEVLKVLAELPGSGSGRASLKEALERQGSILPEGRIRRILSLLNDLKLVESGAGRKGSQVTSRGLAYINWSLNRLLQ